MTKINPAPGSLLFLMGLFVFRKTIVIKLTLKLFGSWSTCLREVVGTNIWTDRHTPQQMITISYPTHYKEAAVDNSWTHCDKRRNCSCWPIFTFATILSTLFNNFILFFCVEIFHLFFLDGFVCFIFVASGKGLKTKIS